MKPMKAQINLSEMELQVIDFWDKNKIFYRSNAQRKDGKEFNFYDGPPFANGLPHYGHLLANTVKDTVPRYWNMRGYYVDRRFGWDTHGVPVEFEVEKTEGLKGRQDIVEMGVDVFNEKCRESVLFYASEWQKTIRRLGRWVDWERQYKTMDPSFMESVWWVFKSLYEKGLVYQGYKVVPYSPRITAVLSNFEANQNYQDVQDPAITVKFELEDEGAFILAWTTTPWTLISNLALAVGPDIEYVKVKDLEGSIYYLAKERLQEVFKQGKKDGSSDLQILDSVKGSALVGRKYKPLFNYFEKRENSFQILAADFVSTDNGTGVVHMAPAYGEDDFQACKEAGIELVDPLDEEAKFKEEIAEYSGLFVKDADKAIIKDLKSAGMLFKQETILHSYPLCERTGGPLIYRAIPSYFVAVEKIKEKMVENNQSINWVPEHLKDGRMGKWLENARDWAISRNRFWGTPLPVWVCSNNAEHVECLGSISELESKTDSKVDDLHKHHIDHLTFTCKVCGGKMTRVSEVFDCWFESGSMPYAQLHYPFENKERFEKNFPADFIAEGLDQTRGWFYTLSVLSAALFERPAFKNVVVNGLVLASDGRKMSKRWKNYTPPLELIDQYGADSVRLYMLNSAILRGEDLKFNNEGVQETTRSVILPLWNSLSFLTTYASADGWEPGKDLVFDPPSVSEELDNWVISKFQSLVGDVNSEMESYRLYKVVPRVVDFIDDLTNWYIRQSRRKFWGGQAEISSESRQAYETLFYILVNFAKILAPFAPFIADRIYKSLTDGLQDIPESVHLCDMPLLDNSLVDSSLERRMELVRNVTEMGRSLRAKHQIKTRQVLRELLVITSNDEDCRNIMSTSKLIRSELNVKKIEFTSDESKYVKITAKPNLRTLGRKLGKGLKQFRAELERLNNAEGLTDLLNELKTSESVSIGDFPGITVEDLLIERGPLDDRLIATSDGVTVLLDTSLDQELIKEGVARELVNRIQNMRKDSGFEITDKIAIKILGSEGIQEAVMAHGEYICSETQAKGLDWTSVQLEGVTHQSSFEIGEEECTIGIRAL